MRDVALCKLLDDREIRDVVLRYCRGIDRMDRELVRSCYHADATDEHGSFSGNVDEFLAWVWPLLERYTQTMHFVGNLLVEVSEDVAAAETYGMAFHRSEDERPQLNLITGFRYLDRFERREDMWRIASRVAVTEWSRVDDAAGRFQPGAGLLQGRRDTADSSYALFERVASGGVKRR
ncbi:MAG: nuclear transport factor 2 family protein [Deltaproteobacteria bacterium]|nr:nuclear transport factor 2 family protein [Deltaproteobacteria bacterium]MBW2359862.1 nuclear transport factor 2 family protein [Deltaproteobacteria bacterium]